VDSNFTFKELRQQKHIMMVKEGLQVRLVFLPHKKGLSLREATFKLWHFWKTRSITPGGFKTMKLVTAWLRGPLHQGNDDWFIKISCANKQIKMEHWWHVIALFQLSPYFLFKLCTNLELPKPHFHGFYCLSLEKCTTQELQRELLPWIK